MDVDSNENSREINCKLDTLLQKHQITLKKHKLEENKEATTAVNILKEATCLADIEGSGFKFYLKKVDGGLVRREVCF